LTKVILLATSDLVTDQRVYRTALSLHNAGYYVVAVGRCFSYTPSDFCSPFSIKYLKIPIVKGFFFYALFNISAFFYLIFCRFDVIQANDLDTLPAAWLAGKLKRKPIVYDSHELFTEVPELIQRPRVKRFWGWLEKRLVIGLKYCSTVSEGVANELKNRYGIHFRVIRNLPLAKTASNNYQLDSRTIIYQGALNLGRGIERLIAAMQFIHDSKLLIAGMGDIEDMLKNITNKLGLKNKVSFLGRVPHHDLHDITCKATIGVSLEEDMGLNYRFALPNKLFDYIQAGLPVLVSDLPEMKRTVEQFCIGTTITSDCNAYALAQKLNVILDNTKQLNLWHENSLKAARELIWEKEEPVLLELFNNALKNK
jgi:glycosyltransferase involved in cell wall biosynthesis